MPRTLFVYFTVSQQTLRVIEAMTDTLRTRGCDVQQARIEFTDPRYAADGLANRLAGSAPVK